MKQAAIDMTWFTEEEQLFLIVTSLGMMKFCVDRDMVEELLDRGSGIDEEFVMTLFNKIELLVQAGGELARKEKGEPVDLNTCEVEGSA